jgi:hypothetical protein
VHRPAAAVGGVAGEPAAPAPEPPATAPAAAPAAPAAAVPPAPTASPEGAPHIDRPLRVPLPPPTATGDTGTTQHETPQ